MALLRNTFIAVLGASTTLLLLLSILGPPPPKILDTYQPLVPTRPRFILGNFSYAAFDTEADRLWSALVPETGGTVLATNLTSGFHFWANLAMFHQLSCLRDIRDQLRRMTNSTEEARQFMADQGSDSRYEQLGYCFDYILQGILCHADTTLHPVAALNSDTKIVDGNALWHMCAADTILYDWASRSGIPRKVREIYCEFTRHDDISTWLACQN
ncbi:hypothetical protein N0V93_005981 [Gnomoniopsis smithogilvyi]|uniref:Uncharacterized protein n=1 Tax=Gnomoniopsis smithogilvyi TaxID=1191159 RepID=A0A9W8YMF9_9PEZI|nr:hypothetical protein N0V93_005981 [Gnomoniopsis smithogilvyi]